MHHRVHHRPKSVRMKQSEKQTTHYYVAAYAGNNMTIHSKLSVNSGMRFSLGVVIVDPSALLDREELRKHLLRCTLMYIYQLLYSFFFIISEKSSQTDSTNCC